LNYNDHFFILNENRRKLQIYKISEYVFNPKKESYYTVTKDKKNEDDKKFNFTELITIQL